MWGSSDVAVTANNYFGLHNSPDGPYPGQIGTYITSGTAGVAGTLTPGWVRPPSPSNPSQAVAAFSADTGFADSAAVLIKKLQKVDVDYSNPEEFFATVHAQGWAVGSDLTAYTRTLLQRYQHVSRY